METILGIHWDSPKNADSRRNTGKFYKPEMENNWVHNKKSRGRLTTDYNNRFYQNKPEGK